MPNRELLNKRRIALKINGLVQGVGFRPFVYRLARELQLTGWIENTSDGLLIECEGDEVQINDFVSRLQRDAPNFSQLKVIQQDFFPIQNDHTFTIRPSRSSSKNTTLVLPDMATCLDCLSDIFDPSNRRYLYPFTNCTCCGPRYSILESLPYDRARTTMKSFVMCHACQKEYEDPLNRRFHAQPNACSVCGPHVEIWNNEKKVLALHQDAIVYAVEAIRSGEIVAVKGLGGFHLMVDGYNEEAVKRLRRRKKREQRPLAVMFPSIEMIETSCYVSDEEKKLVQSPQAPIVLLKRKKGGKVVSSVAPKNPYLGVMLPHTPLHHILMKELKKPIVATSGNISDEPICIDEHEAVRRLKDVADIFCVHNRPIVRQVDDSIMRMVAGGSVVIRRARGIAPLPIDVKDELPSVLGLGGQLKNTISLAVKNNIFVSQHMGDLETTESIKAFNKTIALFSSLYDFPFKHVACDEHPSYYSTQAADSFKKPVMKVQHHHAHVVSCMIENGLDDFVGESSAVLGICFDGSGHGQDGTIWGGEFLVATLKDFKRIGHMKQFSLAGGEIAIKEPRRAAVGILYEIYKNKVFEMQGVPCIDAFCLNERNVIKKMLARQINSPKTSSVGRLFDAVSSLTGLVQYSNFEGQAACALEYALEETAFKEHYSFKIIDSTESFVVDWTRMFEDIIRDVQKKERVGKISFKFHNALIEMIVEVSRRVRQENVVLSGGCFQNKYLLEGAIHRLKEEGFKPFWHKKIPTNDGGISLGQVVVAASQLQKEK